MRELTGLAKRTGLRVVRMVAVGVLTLLLCLGVGLLFGGWPLFTGTPGFSLGGFGYAGMAIGLLAAILLGIGLTLLILHGKHKD